MNDGHTRDERHDERHDERRDEVGSAGREQPVSSPDVAPSVTRSDGRVYFTDGDGKRWRVYDCDFGGGRPRPYEPPRRGVPYRFFVGASGERWVYRYVPGDDARDLTVSALERQRRHSEWAPARKDEYDPGKLGDPR